ncbi:dysbindin domain-containing protein 1 [Erythrolamprus reginae]|uniref:dysbindin domain-containing protein 1 n=1 Tax=Erythrolamprus reginae TaxID=121349 RepID=UPI00396C33BF
MSDQELAEVFADSDEENAAREPPAGLHPTHSAPRAGYLRSPSWTRTQAEPGREKKPPGTPELPADPFSPGEKPKKE